jgi:3D (Asp-Asp-Asp) domain-containing protein
MARVPLRSNPQRVLHATIVALSIASSLTLLGAVHIDRNEVGKISRPITKPMETKVVNVEPPVHVANFAPIEPLLELLRNALPEKLPVREIRAPQSRVVRMEVTAYCPCVKCCGPKAQGITASGKLVNYNNGKFVAADTKVFPFGTKIVVPGYAQSERVEVIDRGGAIKGKKLDLYFATHDEALVWGRQHLDVTVYE